MTVWAPAEVTTAVLEQHDAVLGRQVRSIAGEDMGRVVNVVVDQSGQVRAAIIDFGGFLGVGNRKIAVDWNALHFATTATKDDQITLDLTRDQVKAAPEYKEGRPFVVDRHNREPAAILSGFQVGRLTSCQLNPDHLFLLSSSAVNTVSGVPGYASFLRTVPVAVSSVRAGKPDATRRARWPIAPNSCRLARRLR